MPHLKRQEKCHETKLYDVLTKIYLKMFNLYMPPFYMDLVNCVLFEMSREARLVMAMTWLSDLHIITFFCCQYVGLKRRPRLICALVFRAHTEVYVCYTRRDKTVYYYHILLFYHRVWGLSLENTGEGGGLTVI